MLRTDETVMRFVRDAHLGRALLASICHGPQVLIDARVFPPGTLIIGDTDIRSDLENAGFAVRDDSVVIDEERRLITNPGSEELGPFCDAIGQALLATGFDRSSDS